MAHLLLVDNDARITELFALFLRRSGHDVRIAGDFDSARMCLREQIPDLVLSDLDVGAQNGEAELPKLAREGLLPRTLVVSGYLDVATEARLMTIEGVVGTLRKPFGLDALVTAITAALLRPMPRRSRSEVAPSADGESDATGWIEVVPSAALWPREDVR